MRRALKVARVLPPAGANPGADDDGAQVLVACWPEGESLDHVAIVSQAVLGDATASFR
jgi:hypothetical protein